MTKVKMIKVKNSAISGLTEQRVKEKTDQEYIKELGLLISDLIDYLFEDKEPSSVLIAGQYDKYKIHIDPETHSAVLIDSYSGLIHDVAVSMEAFKLNKPEIDFILKIFDLRENSEVFNRDFIHELIIEVVKSKM